MDVDTAVEPLDDPVRAERAAQDRRRIHVRQGLPSLPAAPAAPPSAMVTPSPHAIVLLSGGLDSATCLALARAEGFVTHALSFRYGQRHAVELVAAERVAAAGGAAEHVVVDIDLRQFGGSALTADLDVPKHGSVTDLDPDLGVPVTYVPARNTIFLSFALAHAEVRGARDIYIGVNALDYSGYPDCRPAFIEAFERMANLATAAAVDATFGDHRSLRVRAPLMELTKGAIIGRGIELGVDYALTTSCYDPVVPDDPCGSDATNWLACGHCDSCLLRRKGFAEAGVVDPIAYLDTAR